MYVLPVSSLSFHIIIRCRCGRGYAFSLGARTGAGLACGFLLVGGDSDGSVIRGFSGRASLSLLTGGGWSWDGWVLHGRSCPNFAGRSFGQGGLASCSVLVSTGAGHVCMVPVCRIWVEMDIGEWGF